MRLSVHFGLLLLVASLATCEARNFDHCLGTDFPCQDGKFCKVNPADPNGVGTCVSAECSIGAAPGNNQCPAETPVCNSQGRCVGCDTNSQCPSATPFCVAQQCVECAAPADCSSNTARPACDATTHKCKACSLHSECASQACVKDDTLATLSGAGISPLTRGQCVPPSRLIVVDEANCTGGASCMLPMQIKAATPTQPYVLIKSYAAKVPIEIPPPAMLSGLPELHIITTTADIPPSKLKTLPPAAISFQSATQPTVLVLPGASVTLEGLSLIANGRAILCDSDNSYKGPKGAPVATSVKLLRSVIGNSTLGIEAHAQCHITVDQSWIGTPPPLYSVPNGNDAAMQLDSTQFEITNSVFMHNYKPFVFGGITITDSKGLQLTGLITSCTFDRHEPSDVTKSALAVYCQSANNALAIFNNVLVNSSGFSFGTKTYVDPNCRPSPTKFGYIATDENLAAAAGPGIVSGLSEATLLTGPDNGNLHLLPTAPMSVIAGGVASFAGVTSPSVDMDGATRSSTSPSIGAFETAH